MVAAHDLGVQGERIAARYLREHGYAILARNFRFGHREIDLIVARDGLIAFVEVKSRAGTGFGHPFEAITARKRREIERVARFWLHRHGHPATRCRFDAVSVVVRRGRPPVIEHLPDAWRLGE